MNKEKIISYLGKYNITQISSPIGAYLWIAPLPVYWFENNRLFIKTDITEVSDFHWNYDSLKPLKIIIKFLGIKKTKKDFSWWPF